MPEGAALGTQEDHPTLTLPEASPHWVYILEPVFPYLVSSKVWILDGDTMQYKGMASAGYTANLVLSHDMSAFYVTETYWSRGSGLVRQRPCCNGDPALDCFAICHVELVEGLMSDLLLTQIAPSARGSWT